MSATKSMASADLYRDAGLLAARAEATHHERIDALEAAIRRDLPAVDMKVVDHFSHGIYARELHIPKGTCLTGKVHKFENLNILSQGALLILREDGSVEQVRAPYTVVSPPGTRRAAFALEDTVWTTIHGTDLRDVDAIEERFIAQTPEEFRLFAAEQLRIGG